MIAATPSTRPHESPRVSREQPRDGVGATQEDKNPPPEWDLAMKGIKVRQKHLQYAIDALDKGVWWGEEALRCHYRRHKASQLFTKQCNKKQDWLYLEAHY